VVVPVNPISGFPEWLPAVRALEQRTLDAIRRAYELFGFAPLETPAVERMEVLTSKSGMQRQIYRLGVPEEGDDQQTNLGLHFDLTVPLARYVAQHADDLVFPFKRYQIQKICRRGRLRSPVEVNPRLTSADISCHLARPRPGSRPLTAPARPGPPAIGARRAGPRRCPRRGTGAPR
jgi:hypothetical protein